MFKAYAVALVLSTGTPTTGKVEEAVKAPLEKQPVSTQAWRIGSVRR